MKKKNISIASPDELNKHLQYTSPTTWIVLGATIAILIAFFAWSFIYKIKVKLTGTANIVGGEVSLNVEESSLNKLKVGQKVYISELEGEILSFYDNGQPHVTTFDLDNGEYTYCIVINEVRPIDFLLSK